MTQVQSGTELFVHQYTDAWNGGRVEDILAFHSEDTAYQLHNGGKRHVGKDAVRTAFVAELARFQTMRVDVSTVHFSDDHAVFQSVVTAHTANAPLRFEMIDLLTLRNGLVVTKDTYVNLATAD